MTGSSILLVDDDRSATELLRHLLAKAGFKGALKAFSHPATALQFLDDAIATGSPPGLIVVDLSLPGMHGCDLVREIRRRLESTPTFVVVVSASDNHADIHQAFTEGADAYLEKFPTVDDLKRVAEMVSRGVRPKQSLCLMRRRNIAP